MCWAGGGGEQQAAQAEKGAMRSSSGYASKEIQRDSDVGREEVRGRAIQQSPRACAEHHTPALPGFPPLLRTPGTSSVAEGQGGPQELVTCHLPTWGQAPKPPLGSCSGRGVRWSPWEMASGREVTELVEARVGIAYPTGPFGHCP